MRKFTLFVLALRIGAVAGNAAVCLDPNQYTPAHVLDNNAACEMALMAQFPDGLVPACDDIITQPDGQESPASLIIDYFSGCCDGKTKCWQDYSSICLDPNKYAGDTTFTSFGNDMSCDANAGVTMPDGLLGCSDASALIDQLAAVCCEDSASACGGDGDAPAVPECALGCIDFDTGGVACPRPDVETCLETCDFTAEHLPPFDQLESAALGYQYFACQCDECSIPSFCAVLLAADELEVDLADGETLADHCADHDHDHDHDDEEVTVEFSLSLEGMTVEAFDEAAQTAFIAVLAGVLDIDANEVEITSITSVEVAEDDHAEDDHDHDHDHDHGRIRRRLQEAAGIEIGVAVNVEVEDGETAADVLASATAAVASLEADEGAAFVAALAAASDAFTGVTLGEVSEPAVSEPALAEEPAAAAAPPAPVEEEKDGASVKGLVSAAAVVFVATFY